MLVCNVSQLQRRAAISAGLTEAAVALDAPGTGNVVFATLVDDPASVRDFVNAYLGQIMVEAANAATTLNAGLTYAAGIVETVTAADTSSAAVPRVGGLVEAATAADLVDGSKISGSVFNGVVALDGPIMPAAPQPAVIYIEG
jgi:hypothetical protein